MAHHFTPGSMHGALGFTVVGRCQTERTDKTSAPLALYLYVFLYSHRKHNDSSLLCAWFGLLWQEHSLTGFVEAVTNLLPQVGPRHCAL